MADVVTKRAVGIPTIDVALVTLEVGADATKKVIALDTASKVGVNPVIETQDASKLIIDGALIAQKPAKNTVTGNTIVLTDNTFTPEVALILQGGTIAYDSVDTTKIVSYEPPVVGSKDKGEVCKICCYSAIYSAAGLITGYEKITYPNCQGTPVAMGSENGVFRVNEYTINSAPDKGQAPYKIEYVDTLPTVA